MTASRAGTRCTARVLVAVALAASTSCDGQVGAPGGVPAVQLALLAPTRMNFDSVADALQPHCGTLDCHGQAGRNLRLMGARGLRLAAGDNPLAGDTTPAEYDATFWSVVGLEPEMMSAVLAQKGADPERLSLIRKARGHERHKGGTLMNAGDNLDRCLLSWLAGGVLEAPCSVARMYDAPGTVKASP